MRPCLIMRLCKSLLPHSCAKSKRTCLICSVNTDKTNTADVQVSHRVLWTRNLNLKIRKKGTAHEILPMAGWGKKEKRKKGFVSNKLPNEAIHILTSLCWIQEMVLMKRCSGPLLTLSCPQGFTLVVPPWLPRRMTMITLTSLPPQSQVTSTPS